MMHPDEAVRIVESFDIHPAMEAVSLNEAMGRVPVVAPRARIDQPPFDKSTMDGFAYAGTADALALVGDSFALVGALAAGGARSRPLASGECIRIMTGAPLPEGATAVHRLERATVEAGRVHVDAVEKERNVIGRGMNGRAGDELFPRRSMRPQDVALLAAHGIDVLDVMRRPRVRVLSTGNELEQPGRPLSEGKIYDSNSYLLLGMSADAGCTAEFSGIIPDDMEAIRTSLVQAAREAEIILVSGGVSAGDFDFVPTAAREVGFELLIHGLAVKPGRPLLLCRRSDTYLFGMPGNPMSAFMGFELLARPLIRKFLGLETSPDFCAARMGETLARRELDRVEFFPVTLENGAAMPVRYTGSTMLSALALANGFVRMEIGQSTIMQGEDTRARLI